MGVRTGCEASRKYGGGRGGGMCVCAIRFQPIDAIWSIYHVIQKAATHKWSRPGAGFIDIHLADEKLGRDHPFVPSSFRSSSSI